MEGSARLASDTKERVFSKLDRILAVAEQIPTEPIVDYANLAVEERWEKEVQWITMMLQRRLNGILVDQMGSRGIPQTLAFIADCKRNGQHGPYMIVSSMDYNGISAWSKMIRFNTTLKEVFYLGNRSDRAVPRKEFVPHLNKWERAMLEEVKRQPLGHKLLLMREPLQNNLAELWSLLNFALHTEFSSREEFDSWFDNSGKEGDGQQTEGERMALLSKLHAILRRFLLWGMMEDVENSVPQNKGAPCYKTEVVQNLDAISVACSNDHATTKGARTDAGSCQEVAAEVVGETGGEVGLEAEVYKAIKRPRTNDASISPAVETNPVVSVQVPKPTSSELIFKALKEIPDLVRADILRAYSTLIRDDRLFESLMGLPLDMRKDWLLMEIGNK